LLFFLFMDTPTSRLYTLSLHDALPISGRDLDEIHVVGGGANNELLCRWTAEAAGRSVLAGPAEATLFGNLLVQAMALGEISSLRSEEHTSELQSPYDLVCRLLLEKKKK